MLRPGAQEDYISRRVNMPTSKSHAEIVRDVDAGTRARSFFSARVVDARRLEKIREVTDAYSRGEFGLGEARNKLKDFLSAEGYDPHQAGLRNLASTGRLNLILKQNAAMAHAAGEWVRMHDPDAMKVFPYVRYHARRDGRTRSEHAHLDGKIFRKDDPFLRTHTPPWEFNCRCYLEEITEKAAGKTPELIQKPTPPEKVRVESRSGFVFDPERAFEEFDMSGVKSPELRGNIREAAEIEFGSQVSFSGAPTRNEFKARFEAKEFHSFEEEKLEPASSWKEKELPEVPMRENPEAARKKLAQKEKVISKTGEEVLFDNECLQHWQVEEAKSEKEIEDRLAWLPMAIETVTNPIEIWDQGTQKGFIKAFQKTTGGFRGCLVFVLKNGKVRTYFLKDLNALNKARKGFSVQKFNLKENGTD